MFSLRVIDGNDGIFECAIFGHRTESNDAGGGFFGAGDDVFYLFGALGEEHSDEVRAVVHGHLRPVIERSAQVRVVGFVVFTLDGVSGDVEVTIERGCDFVLRGKRIGSAEDYVRAAVAKGYHQVGSFAGDVQASGNAQSLQRLFFDEALANDLQHRHLLLCPLDLALASVGQRNVFYIALLDFCGRSHKRAPY